MILQNALLPAVLMTARLDAPTLRRAMSLFAESLRSHRDELNSLNVYPVPDADTGTNLVLTQEAVERALAAATDGNLLPELCEAIARSSLMGARGNSGVILSQILRGLCQALPADGSGGSRELAIALRHGSDEAYRAVARPVEGTVLTVLRDAAGAANDAATSGGSLEAVAATALEAARDSLGRTREVLPALREAGVVDAGGKGVVLLLDALSAAVAGGAPSEPAGPPGPLGRTEEPALSSLEFAHEVQYLLEAPDEALPALRRELDRLGDSLVVVGGGGMFNVHVHTNHPESAVEAARAFGRPREVSITTLEGRMVGCLTSQARGVRIAEQTSAPRPTNYASVNVPLDRSTSGTSGQ